MKQAKTDAPRSHAHTDTAIILAKHSGNPAAEELVANMRREARLYEAYHAYYGYTFFIGKKA